MNNITSSSGWTYKSISTDMTSFEHAVMVAAKEDVGTSEQNQKTHKYFYIAGGRTEFTVEKTDKELKEGSYTKLNVAQILSIAEQVLKRDSTNLKKLNELQATSVFLSKFYWRLDGASHSKGHWKLWFMNLFNGITGKISTLYGSGEKATRLLAVEEARQFALSLISDDTRSIAFISGQKGYETPQPTNKQIGQLAYIYSTGYQDAIEKAMEKGFPWDNPDTLNLINDGMKIAYTISMLTLEDLDSFKKNLKELGEKDADSNRITLMRQDAYPYRAFYYLPQLYHRAREGIIINGERNYTRYFNEEEEVEKYRNKFYTVGTPQLTWNSLFNCYCQAVDQAIGTEASDFAEAEGGRAYKWTRQDFIDPKTKKPTFSFEWSIPT